MDYLNDAWQALENLRRLLLLPSSSLKPKNRPKIDEVLTIVQNKDFWWKSKALRPEFHDHQHASFVKASTDLLGMCDIRSARVARAESAWSRKFNISDTRGKPNFL